MFGHVIAALFPIGFGLLGMIFGPLAGGIMRGIYGPEKTDRYLGGGKDDGVYLMPFIVGGVFVWIGLVIIMYGALHG